MTTSRYSSSVGIRSLMATTVLFGALLLGSTAARAETNTVSTAPSTSLHLGFSTPLIIPNGFASQAGVGIMPGIGLGLGNHFSIDLTGGYIHYDLDHGPSEHEIPVLLGATYTFMDPSVRVRPYVTGKLGYTNSRQDGHTEHWFSAVVGGGGVVRLSRGFALNFGAGIVVADILGKAEDTLGLMFRLGMSYRI